MILFQRNQTSSEMKFLSGKLQETWIIFNMHVYYCDKIEGLHWVGKWRFHRVNNITRWIWVSSLSWGLVPASGCKGQRYLLLLLVKLVGSPHLINVAAVINITIHSTLPLILSAFEWIWVTKAGLCALVLTRTACFSLPPRQPAWTLGWKNSNYQPCSCFRHGPVDNFLRTQSPASCVCSAKLLPTSASTDEINHGCKNGQKAPW